MSAPRNGQSRGAVNYRQMQEVIAYSEDLHVWIYYDQTDDILRYEAYIISYDSKGEPSTLDFVIDDGILPWATALGRHFTNQNLRSPGARQSLWAIPRHTKDTLVAPTLNLYLQLSQAEIDSLHKLFAAEELRLKSKNRAAWTGRLRALGYDVIASLC